jgi:hypothetical protein
MLHALVRGMRYIRHRDALEIHRVLHGGCWRVLFWRVIPMLLGRHTSYPMLLTCNMQAVRRLQTCHQA